MGSKKAAGQLVAVVSAVALIVVVGLVTVVMARKDTSLTGTTRDGATVVQGLIAPDKTQFFEDPEVQAALRDRGYKVRFETAGSRTMPVRELDDYDFAFPSSTETAEKLASQHGNLGMTSPFSSPIAIATFTNILNILDMRGVASRVGDTWFIDMEKLAELTQSGQTWSDISKEYSSTHPIQVASTDLASSNSAVLYLSILTSILAPEGVGSIACNADLVAALKPFFSGQRFGNRSTLGGFGDYLDQGIEACRCSSSMSRSTTPSSS